jgi:hypothetical protein
MAQTLNMTVAEVVEVLRDLSADHVLPDGAETHGRRKSGARQVHIKINNR